MLSWSLHYAALLEYYKEHGHCNVPYKTEYQCKLRKMGENRQSYQYDGKLGLWLCSQKQQYAGTAPRKLSDAQMAKLQLLIDQGSV